MKLKMGGGIEQNDVHASVKELSALECMCVVCPDKNANSLMLSESSGLLNILDALKIIESSSSKKKTKENNRFKIYEHMTKKKVLTNE